MQKILLTGSSGFIGKYLTKELDSKYNIYHLKSDLRDYDKVRKEVLSFDPNIIIHLAARTEVESSFYEQITFSEINYVGSVNLIESAKDCTDLQLFLAASTMETYGWQPISDIVESGVERWTCAHETTAVHGIDSSLRRCQRIRSCRPSV